ncbi:MAG: hypothetical protein V4492_08885 [Chlamydiota bacterium]
MIRNCASLNQLNSRECLFGTLFFAGAGAIAAPLLNGLSPWGGSIYGIGFFASNRLFHKICDKYQIEAEGRIAKIAKSMLSLTASIAGATFISQLAGFSITFLGGVSMAGSITMTTLLSTLIFCGCLGLTTAISGTFMNPKGARTYV